MKWIVKIYVHIEMLHIYCTVDIFDRKQCCCHVNSASFVCVDFTVLTALHVYSVCVSMY